MTSKTRTTRILPLHPELNELVSLAFLTSPTIHITNCTYSDTAFRSVDYILHILGQTPPPYNAYPPYKADHRKGELVYAEAFMTHVKATNPTLKFVDHGRDP